MPNDSIIKTIIVAFLLCVFCSVLVSSSAIYLKPLQEKNKLLETKKNILIASGLMEEGKTIEEMFKQITVRIIDLKTGEFDDEIDPSQYDVKKAIKDPLLAYKIPKDLDLAKIKRRAKSVPVYLVMKEDQIDTVILPIYGKGLWSTMYAFLALEGDTNTVKGLSFYEHAETPGLGGEVDNELWKKSWKGKKVFSPDWAPVIDLPKAKVDPQRPEAIHQVDGLSGATLTTRGVKNLLRYWLGENGYGPFLANLRQQGV